MRYLILWRHQAYGTEGHPEAVGFPKIRGSQYGAKIVGLGLLGHNKKDPIFKKQSRQVLAHAEVASILKLRSNGHAKLLSGDRNHRSRTCWARQEWPKRSHKHKDSTNHDNWYPPSIGPWNQNVRSLCLCGLLGPQSGGTSSDRKASHSNLERSCPPMAGLLLKDLS